VLSVCSLRMSSPPIPVPASTSRHAPYESLSHSHPNESGNKPVLSPVIANRNPGNYCVSELQLAIYFYHLDVFLKHTDMVYYYRVIVLYVLLCKESIITE
jgi:hypothetical protein